MPSAIGYVSEEQQEVIEDLIERGQYEDQSDFIQFCVSYTLEHKHRYS